MPRPTIQNRPITKKPREVRASFQSVSELDHLRELARGASLEIAQLKPGTMQGMLAHVDLGPSSIHLNHFTLPARGRGSLAPDRWTFVVFPVGTNARFNARELDAATLLIYPPGTEFEGTTAGKFHDWVFTVETGELARACEIRWRLGLASLPDRLEVTMPLPETTARLRDFAISTLSSVESSPHLLDDDQIRRGLHTQLIELLLDAVSVLNARQLATKETPCSHWQLVRQVEDLVRGNLDGMLTLTQLCESTSVSERTLRRAFCDVIGVSPHSYLKILRLHRVHAELKQTSRGEASVTATAMRWGFTHLGRLSVEYRQFFGESPSQTLARRHR